MERVKEALRDFFERHSLRWDASMGYEDIRGVLWAHISGMSVKNEEDLEAFRMAYVSKKGSFSKSLSEFLGIFQKELSRGGGSDSKRHLGQFFSLRSDALSLFKQHASRLREEEKSRSTSSFSQDLTLPVQQLPQGGLHPLRQFAYKVMDLFLSQGFEQVNGPEIEDDWHNFTALNFEEHHPARDTQDTFFLHRSPDKLLRTHTSSVQVRMMEQYPPPLRMLAFGRVYRNEAVTARSNVLFHQLEGIYVDEGVSFLDLKNTLLYFVSQIFGANIPMRFRPSYFPFTEPSAELDLCCTICEGKGCAICKQSGWLEVAGCGLVDENVLRNCKIDPEKYSGYAFGMGIERLAMLHYGIHDIRLFFQNDRRFLRQFEVSKENHTGFALFHYNRGNVYNYQEEYDKAIEDFTKAIDLDPYYSSAYIGRGEVYNYQEEYNKAIEDFTKAIRLKPDYSKAYYDRGYAYYSQKDYGKAIEDYNEAIRLKPDYSNAYYSRGLAYYRQGKYGKAIKDFTKAIRLSPDYLKVLAYHGRGIVYYKQGKYDKAIEDYNEAIRLDPNYSYTYNDRGNAYTKQGKHDKAIEDYNEAIRLNPDDSKAYNSRGNAYRRQGKHDKAIKDYNEAIRLNPDDSKAYHDRGNVYYRQEEYDKAIKDFTKAIRFNPNEVFYYQLRGYVYSDQEEYDKAIEDFTQAIRLNPNYSIAYYVRGYAYTKQGKPDKAQKDYETAKRLKSKN